MDYDWDISMYFMMVIVIIIVGAIVIPMFLGIWQWLVYKYKRFQFKRKKFYISDCYVVGYPSGEIMFLDDVETFHVLKNKKLVEWQSEYKCYCYRDYEKNYIKRVLKFF